MAKSDTVKRWVLVDGQGRYSIDDSGGQFSDELAEAHIFVGPVRHSAHMRMLPVTVSVVRQTDGSS